MGGCDQPATTTAPIHTEARPVAVSPTPAGAVLTIEPKSNTDELVRDEACDHEAYEAELARRNLAVLEAKSAMFDLLTPQDAAQSEVIVPDYPSKGIEEMHYRRIESRRLPGKMRAAPMPTHADRLE